MPSSLDIPHASPPQSTQQQVQSPSAKKNSQSSSLLHIIAVAICFVLAFHWYLVIHHVSYHAPHGFPGFQKGKNDFRLKKGKYRGRYILSPVCGGCYRTYDEHMTPCFDLIQQYMKKNANTTLREASQKIGTEVKECGICNPDTCFQHTLKDKYKPPSAGGMDQKHGEQKYQYQTKYWRFDQTAPQIENPASIVLPAIPEELRIPTSRFDDIEAFIRTKYANPDPDNTTSIFLIEYNPGIARIPQHMRPHLPPNAVYAMTLRVTPHNFCVPVSVTESLPEEIKQTMHSLNYMGFMLLDGEYKPIEGHNAVIDIAGELDARRNHWLGEPPFVDYRLFNLNNELYLHINSDTVIITKIRLRSKTNTDEAQRKVDWEEDRKIREKKEKKIQLNNLYGGDSLEVTLLHQFNTIWGETRESMFGKNYALFSLPNATHPAEPDAIYAEMSVHPDHMVMQILPNEHVQLPRDRKIKWRLRRNFKIDHIIQRKMLSVGNATVSKTFDSPTASNPSFFNADEHWFPGGINPFKEFAHGGACCVLMTVEAMRGEGVVLPSAGEDKNWEGVDSVLLGVGHTLVKYYNKKKLPEKEQVLMPDTNYVSFFYAFDSRPPFQLLARSGYFCLGFASPSKGVEGGTPNPRAVLTHHRPLQQHNETFACSQIHYISTIIEKEDDPSTVVVGYGMNDCMARLVEVSKREIVRLLFPDWGMVVSTSS